MSDFPIVDLESQAGAVARHMHGWSVSEKLAWLRQHGSVSEVWTPYNLGEHYAFTSRAGISTPFRLTPSGTFLIVREYRLIDPLEDDTVKVVSDITAP